LWSFPPAPPPSSRSLFSLYPQSVTKPDSLNPHQTRRDFQRPNLTSASQAQDWIPLGVLQQPYELLLTEITTSGTHSWTSPPVSERLYWYKNCQPPTHQGYFHFRI
jgi:hypothetical protein